MIDMKTKATKDDIIEAINNNCQGDTDTIAHIAEKCLRGSTDEIQFFKSFINNIDSKLTLVEMLKIIQDEIH